MEAYAPSSILAVVAVALSGAVLLAIGLVLRPLTGSAAARRTAWALVPCAVAFTAGSTAHEPAGFRMVALVVVLFMAMKLVVLADSRTVLPVGRWLAFVLAWPGMRPALLERRAPRPCQGWGRHVAHGLGWVGAGAGLLALARAGGGWPLATLALALIGISALLHFGLFRLAVGIWRRAGFDVAPLFRAPLLATHLREFWGRRWNRPFSEMLQGTIVAPLAARHGRRAATLGAFAFSGLLHEVAISMPVDGGYGLPLLYFVVQGALVELEGVRPRRAAGFAGRLCTASAVLIPLPLLFHGPFLDGVVRPLLVAG